MCRDKLILLLGITVILKCNAQTELSGVVVDAVTYETLSEVKVQIESSTFETKTDPNGKFSFSSDLIPEGNQVLIFVRPGYLLLRLPIIISKNKKIYLDLIPLKNDVVREQLQASTISLSENELSSDEGGIDNVSGLLQASRDIFLNAAAFDFSPTFYRPRGIDSEYGKVLINGIEMNTVFTGRPEWGQWGGLNDLQRQQEFSMGLQPGESSFGGLAGTTNIIMRASQYAKGGRISYAASNKSYTGRIMGSYSSGEQANGWTYAILLSRRFAEEGFVDGTVYNANSFMLALEKKINNSHSINFTGFYTPNTRGKSSANTQEVVDLKGNRYNSYWGNQNGKIRNSRLKQVEEPVLMINDFWKISDNVLLNTNLAYQFGKTANSHLDYGGTRLVISSSGEESFIGGGKNPDPSYYQYLPSYFLRFQDDQNYEAAYLAEKSFQKNGQLNWNSLYAANLLANGNSIYVLARDVNKDRQITANAILKAVLSESLRLNAKIRFTSLASENYAEVMDLLGGNAYLDIDYFAEGDSENLQSRVAQTDLLHPNRLAQEGEKFKYDFNLFADIVEAFSNVEYTSKKIDFYLSGNVSSTQYQREGLFQTGAFPQNSLGRSKSLDFFDYGAKAGATYKVSGRHLFNLNTAYFTKAPLLKNSFTNARQNNTVVEGLGSEEISSADFGYIYRTSAIKFRITGYFSEIANATQIAFFYADGLSGIGRSSTTAFVQEILEGINKQYIGVEAGLESQLTTTIKIKLAAGIGEFTYSNNPNLYLTSNNFSETVNYGKAYLKNYNLGNGPQQAAQIGFEYRDPDYWWFGATVNYFSHSFSGISPLSRTSNFSTDSDGLPLLDYDPAIAEKLLKQEQFNDYFLVNAIGGKSWRLKKNYLGFFASINNIFDVLYKTGGFEQSRNANFRTLKEDRERESPIFGNKYWYGTGTTYYVNLYVRF
ncbi:MAG: TonB-dependent receptor [Gillisia sp.]